MGLLNFRGTINGTINFFTGLLSFFYGTINHFFGTAGVRFGAPKFASQPTSADPSPGLPAHPSHYPHECSVCVSGLVWSGLV